MQCSKCQLENPPTMKFCGGCGARLVRACRDCQFENPPEFKFCGNCGCDLEQVADIPETSQKTEGERKHATVLFSDLAGYVALTERLDPEEVKDIMGRIFAQIAQVVEKYEGTVERFFGDEVLVLFGVPITHEDDPVRAIRVAREIHRLVGKLSPQFEQKIGQPLAMHIGINTGLLITGEEYIGKGRHGLTGDTVNLASRLTKLAQPGETIVGPNTYRLARGSFNFELFEPMQVKGKREVLQVAKVLSPKEQPSKTYTLAGLRADLIGRKVEMGVLREAIEMLQGGQGSIVSICGDAGTGKSRLIEEFKASLDFRKIQWRYGCSYPYAQNITYFPLTDLLSRAFRIEESDSSDTIKEKIESGIESIGEKNGDIVPFIGSLYSLSYPETENVSPEFWKTRLHESMKTILSAIVKMMPTVICLEDLQWADQPSIELLRYVLSELRYPVLFVCVHRPTFTLCSSHQIETLGYPYTEIMLNDLTASDAQVMLESLLNTQDIPLELRRFIREKLEGNPFYLEEVINSLVDSRTLINVDGRWQLTRPINESDISSNIYGVISGRIDRLENETKYILQQASVIGKVFLYDILEKITEIRTHIDGSLRQLEQLDLIRARILQPDLEYIFKHALTQEVVYNGLLKRDRQAIHERIALVMEQLFQDRLPEFYEALGYHFSQGVSVHKAFDYLIKSGGKSFKRHALLEAHQYYKTAYDLLSNKPDKTEQEKNIIIKIILEWGYVFNSRGAFKDLEELLKANEELAESLVEKEGTGMFYAWLGWALRSREKLEEGYQYLHKALTLGEELKNDRIVGYACAWLTWTCGDMGFLEQAVDFGNRAIKISELLQTDHELSRYSYAGTGVAYYFRGDSKKADEVGKFMLAYGEKVSDLRFISMGHNCIGFMHYIAGDLTSAIKCYKKAIYIIKDTIYSNAGRLLLGMSYLADGQLEQAEETLDEIVRISEEFSFEFLGTAARSFAAIIMIAKGNLSKGEKIVLDVTQVWKKNGSRYRFAAVNHTLGKFYLQIFLRTGPKSLPFLVKNIGFLAKTIPFADRKAESCFNKAIEVSNEIGAKSILGQAYLDLAILHKAKNRLDLAREDISEAIPLFEKCEADAYLKQAKEVLVSL